MDKEEIIVGCGPVAWPGVVVKDAQIESCAICSSKIWVSPSSRELRSLDPSAKMICLPCVFETVSPEEQIHLAPGVVDDLAKVDPGIAKRVQALIQKGVTVKEIRELLQP